MSKHSVPGGDFAGLMERFAQLQEKAKLRTGQSFRIIVVQEAGLDVKPSARSSSSEMY